MASPAPVTLSTYAMATRFEIVLHGDDPVRLRAAGEEALREIERLDAQLSLYRSESELNGINARAGRGSVKVEPRLFRLLELCADFTARTDGAFDVTVAPLMRAWGFVGDTGKTPDPTELESARSMVGMRHIRLDEERFTVQFAREGVEIDLGAVGKGHAIERAARLLRENGVVSALLHGGTSTVYAVGAPPEQSAWRVAVRRPTGEEEELETVDLRDCSLSVSAVYGKSFADGGREFGHVLDPRTGAPAGVALAAAVWGPSPTQCDALSTALLVLGESWLPMLRERFPGYAGLAAVPTPGGVRISRTGRV